MPRRSPLREQSFRLGILIIPMIVIATIGAVVLLNSPGATHVPVAWFIGLAVFIVVLAVVAITAGLAIGRRVVGDRIEVALRTPGSKWGHARVTVGPDVLFVEGYVWQVRIRSGQTTELRGVHLGDDSGRRPRVREWWSLNPQLHIVDVDSDLGRFELAALPSRISEIRDRLRQAPPQGTTSELT